MINFYLKIAFEENTGEMSAYWEDVHKFDNSKPL
jgi:hypothetical protein